MADVMAHPPRETHLRMNPADKTLLRDPPLDAMRPFITPTDQHYVLAALGIPHSDSAEWSVTVGGSVEHPFVTSVDEIRSLPSQTLAVTLECAGDPVRPDKPLRRVSTARWRGVPLADIIAQARPHPGSTHVWLDGADWGVYRPGTPTAERVSEYRKDLPLERIRSGDVLLAYEMNGEALPPVHGYPIRVIVPGYYGTNSVKWIKNLVVAKGRPSGLFSSVFYNTEKPVDGAIERSQVGEVSVSSMLTSHQSGDRIATGAHHLFGWAWGVHEVARVEVRLDADGEWLKAKIGKKVDHAWQPFEATCEIRESGRRILSVRATDCRGNQQPFDEHINQVASIALDVV